MLTAQVHQGLLTDSGIDLLAQSHDGLLAAAVIPVEPVRWFDGGESPLLRRRAKQRREDEEILSILMTAMESIQ